MELEGALKKLMDNPKLAEKIERAVKSKVNPTEFYGVLVEDGVDTETAEAAMVEYQRRRGLTIADEEVDDEMLRKVAGGGCGTDCSQANDCNKRFKDSSWWNEERCIYANNCDEVLGPDFIA